MKERLRDLQEFGKSPQPGAKADRAMRKSKRVTGPNGQLNDSMMAVFKNRLTYTFIHDNEVASIHFDRDRGEIFYKGHNIVNMQLTPSQNMVLSGMEAILANDDKGSGFLAAYKATLTRCLADN